MTKQKDAIRELKKDPNFENKSQNSDITINANENPRHPEYISIASIITEAVKKEFSKYTSRDSDTNIITNNGSRYHTGSIGSIFMNRRRGDKK